MSKQVFRNYAGNAKKHGARISCIPSLFCLEIIDDISGRPQLLSPSGPLKECPSLRVWANMPMHGRVATSPCHERRALAVRLDVDPPLVVANPQGPALDAVQHAKFAAHVLDLVRPKLRPRLGL